MLESSRSDVRVADSLSIGITRMSSPPGPPDLQAESNTKVSSKLRGASFLGVEKTNFLAMPLSSSLELLACEFFRRNLRLMVEFQWFLMELSVRPGSNLAICAHLLPYLHLLSLTLYGRLLWSSLITPSTCLY